jgi:multiple sugar transport system substrate-binding protein
MQLTTFHITSERGRCKSVLLNVNPDVQSAINAGDALGQLRQVNPAATVSDDKFIQALTLLSNNAFGRHRQNLQRPLRICRQRKHLTGIAGVLWTTSTTF